jgi:hypothetical protein
VLGDCCFLALVA